MKSSRLSPRSDRRGFTLLEVMVSITVVAICLAACMTAFLFALRMMYKDNQRLLTNASLRSFTAQISKETLDASTFYLFPYYTSIDASVNLATDPTTATFVDSTDAADFDKWIAHGDCLVLVTKTSQFRTTDIRQIRIYYRTTTSQATKNAESTLRYYETADWGEGTSSTANGHAFSGLASELNTINLNANPSRAGSRSLNTRTKGRAVPSPYTGYAAGDYYPMFSTESATASPSNGFISINVEFINGSNSGANRLLSSSSFNYTISPRR